jgi:hypothetical protein
MTAQAAGKKRITPSLAMRRQFTLLSGKIAYHGAWAAVILTGTNAGKWQPATGASNEKVLGKFVENVDASASGFNADSLVTVEFDREKTLSVCVNGASTDAFAATDVGKIAYALDDQTCTIVPNASPLGRFYGLDAVGLCLIELGEIHGAVLKAGSLVAPVTGDIIVTAAAIINRAVYLLPSLATNSTVTLPTTGVPDGTQITVVADGTQGAFTTTYRYGTTSISAALTASKGHTAILTKYGSIWSAATTAAP